jgi:hypothetical protein
MRTRLIAFAAIGAAITIALLIGPIVYRRGVQFGYWQPLSRPQGVPRTAHYVSLVETGTWFDCSVDHALDVDWCTAWDFTGKLIAKGAFQLEDEHRAATESELYPSLVEASEGNVHGIYLFRKQTFLRGGVDAFSRKLVPATPAAFKPLSKSGGRHSQRS